MSELVETRGVYLPPLGSSGLVSMAQLCPGLHGPEARVATEETSYRGLFDAVRNESAVLEIPLFQRRYCWGDALARGWWESLVSSRGYHHTGGVLTKRREEDGACVIIDGQQRVTTALLVVAALRDAALALALDCGCDLQGASCESGESFVLRELVESLERALYSDARAVAAWAREKARARGVHPQDRFRILVGF